MRPIAVVIDFGYPIMALRELVWMNYNAGFWLGAVRVKEEEIKVGDVLVLGDCLRLEREPYCDVVEVRVIAVNYDGSATVIVRGGGVENVGLDNLRRPDWWSTPRFWRSGGPRGIPRYRRPLHKDEMLKHGVAVVGDIGINAGHRDFMARDWYLSMQAGIRSRER